ncbi:putative XRE-type DNA-binding protein [Caulobacter ginsengisoli]|uniref:XRE-type DNA-binding protein n=1 Tax=Caulobacter ginsengisoli TaxID=400775 RepID=A0ABU0IY57_9CAUL|nr:helix-turn-helix transcriptional regulator [Caulobacter ginsengisoli]MDQ0465887.1 putative XRE-type DNA-binding protein [Caulobacter ginsengisoli]
MTDDNGVRESAGNIFEDLNFPDAEAHLLKAQLVSRMQDTISDRKLSQSEAGRITGVSQPDISRMLKGQFRDVSVERIMRMLTRLGCDVDITVQQRGREPFAPIHLEALPA